MKDVRRLVDDDVGEPVLGDQVQRRHIRHRAFAQTEDGGRPGREEGRRLPGGDHDRSTVPGRDRRRRGDPVSRDERGQGGVVGIEVVGVLAPKGATMGGNQDNFVIIPITTGLNRYGMRWRSLTILVQAPDKETYDDCLEQVRGIMRVELPGFGEVMRMRSMDTRLQVILATQPVSKRMRAFAISSNFENTGTPTASTCTTSPPKNQ